MDAESAPRIPRHIAIVMDGNGRWAERRRRPRSLGHREGQKAVRAAIEFCLRRGVEALTLFAFSSENWNRPQSEVGALMQLFLKALDREVDELHENGVGIAFVGDLSAFQPELRERMHGAMRKTGANEKLKLNIAVNYGGRWDIADAARRVALEVAAGRIPGIGRKFADRIADLVLRQTGDLGVERNRVRLEGNGNFLLHASRNIDMLLHSKLHWSVSLQ